MGKIVRGFEGLILRFFAGWHCKAEGPYLLASNEGQGFDVTAPYDANAQRMQHQSGQNCDLNLAWPTPSDTYEPSAVIRLQNTTPARPLGRNPCDVNLGKSTIRKKCGTAVAQPVVVVAVGHSVLRARTSPVCPIVDNMDATPLALPSSQPQCRPLYGVGYTDTVDPTIIALECFQALI